MLHGSDMVALSNEAAPLAFFGLLLWCHDVPAKTAKESDEELALPPVKRFVAHTTRFVKQSTKMFRLAMLNTDRDTDPTGPATSLQLSALCFLRKAPAFAGEVISRQPMDRITEWSLLCATQVPEYIIVGTGGTLQVVSTNPEPPPGDLVMLVHDPIIRVSSITYSVDSRSHVILGASYHNHGGSCLRYFGRLSLETNLVNRSQTREDFRRLRWYLSTSRVTTFELDEVREHSNSRSLLGLRDGTLMELNADATVLLRDIVFDPREAASREPQDDFMMEDRGPTRCTSTAVDRKQGYFLRMGVLFVVNLANFTVTAKVTTTMRLGHIQSAVSFTSAKGLAVHPTGDALLVLTDTSLLVTSRLNPRITWSEWGRQGCHLACAPDVALSWNGVLDTPCGSVMCVIEAPVESTDRRTARVVFWDAKCAMVAI